MYIGARFDALPMAPPASARPAYIGPSPVCCDAEHMTPDPTQKTTAARKRPHLRPKKWPSGYPQRDPKNAPAWYVETTFALVVSESIPNSLVNDLSAIVPPMKAES